MKYILRLSISIIVVICFCSCASTPPPLKYLATEKPTGIIKTVPQQKIEEEFSRGGWYFGNHNFRPTADLESYIKKVESNSDQSVLRDADVNMNVPFAIDILLFGYNNATDKATAFKPAEK